MKKNNKRSGQAMVEYIIIVVVIAIAALVVFGLFGDTLTKKTAGAVSTLDKDLGSEAQAAAAEKSLDKLKSLDSSGIE